MAGIEVQELLKPEYIFIGVTPLSAARTDALRSMCRLFARKSGFSEGTLLNGFQARELAGSTSIGDGIAIPHTQIPGLFSPIISVVHFDRKIDWDTIDGEPVEVAVAFITPEGKQNLYLDILAAFARQLAHEEFNRKLKSIKDAEKLYQFIIQEMEKEG